MDSKAIANQTPKGSAKKNAAKAKSAAQVQQKLAMAYPKTALGWQAKLYQSMFLLLSLLIMWAIYNTKLRHAFGSDKAFSNKAVFNKVMSAWEVS